MASCYLVDANKTTGHTVNATDADVADVVETVRRRTRALTGLEGTLGDQLDLAKDRGDLGTRRRVGRKVDQLAHVTEDGVTGNADGRLERCCCRVHPGCLGGAIGKEDRADKVPGVCEESVCLANVAVDRGHLLVCKGVRK